MNSSNFTTTISPTSVALERTTSSAERTRLIVFQVLSYIINILIILGNSFVIWIIIRKKSLHTVTNMLLISLAVSDLLVGLGLLPSFLACIHVECDLRLSKMIYDYFLFVSVANLCAITVDRYTAVMHPLRYQTKMTPINAVRVITLAWLIPLPLSIPPIIWTYSNASLEHQLLANKIFYTLQVLFFVFIPCCLMLWAYAKIFREAMKQARRVQPGPRQGTTAENHTHASTEAKNAFKVFGTIVTIFILCWLLSAYRTFVIYYNLGKVDAYVTTVSRLLLILNSALNPIFYTLWKRDVRREVGRLFIGRRNNSIHPEISASNPSFVISQQAATIGN